MNFADGEKRYREPMVVNDAPGVIFGQATGKSFFLHKRKQ